MGNKNNQDSDRIQRLIEAEVEAGFRIFSEKELRARLEERLKEGKKQRQFRWISLKPVPLCVGILVVVLGMLTGVLFVGKKSEQTYRENLISRFLEKTPGVRTLAQWEELHGLRSKLESSRQYPHPANFTGIFERVEEDSSVKKPGAQISDFPQYPTLDYGKRLEILFKEKAVHQFLNRFYEIQEEEKNEKEDIDPFSVRHLFL